MTTELPPEMRAMNAAMDMVFKAVKQNAAPQSPADANSSRRDQGSAPEVAAAVAAPQTSKRQIDIEKAIMEIPGFDYITAWELTAAIQARLESVYEEKLNSKVDEAMKNLRAELDHITG